MCVCVCVCAPVTALAKARRAKGGSAWGSPTPSSSTPKAGDDPNFPKLVVTRESHASIVRVGSYVDIRSNTSIAVAPDDESVAASAHERGAFASGRVFDIADSPQEGVPAMARVHLQWNLADGSPATLHTPVTNLVVRPEEDRSGNDRVIITDNTSIAMSPSRSAQQAVDSPASAAETTGSVSSAIDEDAVAEPKVPLERPAAKSRILPSSGGSLSTTEYVLETDDDDGGEWVTPANIGSHLGHDGFTKAFSTVGLFVVSLQPMCRPLAFRVPVMTTLFLSPHWLVAPKLLPSPSPLPSPLPPWAGVSCLPVGKMINLIMRAEAQLHTHSAPAVQTPFVSLVWESSTLLAVQPVLCEADGNDEDCDSPS